MTIEKSYGGVIFTRIKNEIFYVVIKHISGHFGFPKGHQEKNESGVQTALREIYEETGLNVRIKKGFAETTLYPIPDKADNFKEVTYFLAEYENQNILINKNELESAHLLTYPQALKMLNFQNLRDILYKANEFIAVG